LISTSLRFVFHSGLSLRYYVGDILLVDKANVMRKILNITRRILHRYYSTLYARPFPPSPRFIFPFADIT
jgi:hypothetical protein